MKSYLIGEDIKQRQKGRVIVIDYKGFDTGLVVEEVYGMRHFTENEAIYDLPSVPESISPYIKLAFEKDEEVWPVFSFDNMTQEERCSHASL
jgi:twitching motility protein PilI